jgi:hypothetical protein
MTNFGNETSAMDRKNPGNQRFPRTAQVVVALIVSYVLMGVMAFWTLAYLRRTAGGLLPFDLRPFGYTPDEARTLLHALSGIGRAYYADVQLQLDTAFPAVYALSRGLLLLWLTAPGRTAARPLPLPARFALLLLPLATAWFDYFENEGIAAMLAADQKASDELIERTSFLTRAKLLAALATELMCLTLAAIAFVRWRHRRQSQPR